MGIDGICPTSTMAVFDIDRFVFGMCDAQQMGHWLLVFEGLLVYSLMQDVKLLPKNSLRLGFSVIIAFMLFLPWQLYCFTHFHDNALYEWTYNQRHFWEVLEGHSHERDFYINQLKFQFSFLQAFIFTGILLSLFKIERFKYILPVLVMVVSLYIFFTIAATKIASYVMVTMPLLFVFMAYAFTSVFDFFSYKKYRRWCCTIPFDCSAGFGAEF
jgi:4-amino-4-deoxy-L-arabinose transferase-like glycosyltransferase